MNVSTLYSRSSWTSKHFALRNIFFICFLIEVIWLGFHLVWLCCLSIVFPWPVPTSPDPLLSSYGYGFHRTSSPSVLMSELLKEMQESLFSIHSSLSVLPWRKKFDSALLGTLAELCLVRVSCSLSARMTIQFQNVHTEFIYLFIFRQT